MIRYLLGNEVEKKDIHKAFHAGFIDYVIKVDIPEEIFFEHFYGPEGNMLSLTSIAYFNEEPIGIVMGGIRYFDNMSLTLRCGGLGVAPEYRGTGVAQELMRRHIESGKKKGCTQFMLEVIGTNDRAIQFYEKLGYKRMYQLEYFSVDPKLFRHMKDLTVEVVQISSEDIVSIETSTHVNWQNRFEYFSHVKGVHIYGVHSNGNIVSYIVLDDKGKIYSIWGITELELEKYVHSLIHHSIKMLKPEKMTISFPSNPLLTQLILNAGFKKETLFQYEMYLDV